MPKGFHYVYSADRIKVASHAVLASIKSRRCFDSLADAAAAALRCPVALVSIVEDGRQCFVGQCGLTSPWDRKRETPLSHSFCQHAVAEAAPLIIDDARIDHRVRDNLAVSELGVIAYAGIPIRLASGTIVGSLCAIGTRPRAWTTTEINLLKSLATVAAHVLDREILLYLEDHEAEVASEAREPTNGAPAT